MELRRSGICWGLAEIAAHVLATLRPRRSPPPGAWARHSISSLSPSVNSAARPSASHLPHFLLFLSAKAALIAVPARAMCYSASQRVPLCDWTPSPRYRFARVPPRPPGRTFVIFHHSKPPPMTRTRRGRLGAYPLRWGSGMIMREGSPQETALPWPRRCEDGRGDFCPSPANARPP